MMKQKDTSCFITNGYFEMNKAKFMMDEFKVFYEELKDVFKGENINNLEVLDNWCPSTSSRGTT